MLNRSCLPVQQVILLQMVAVLLWDTMDVASIGWIQDMICFLMNVSATMMVDGSVLEGILTIVGAPAIVVQLYILERCVLLVVY